MRSPSRCSRVALTWSPAIAALPASPPSHAVACRSPHRSPSSRNSLALCSPSRSSAFRSARRYPSLARVLSTAAVPHRSPVSRNTVRARSRRPSTAGTSPRSVSAYARNHSARARPAGSATRSPTPPPHRAGRRVGLAQPPLDPGRPGPRPGPHRGGRPLAGRQPRTERAPGLGQPASQEPVPRQRAGEPQCPLGIRPPYRMLQGLAQVGGLVVEPPQPPALIVPVQPLPGPFGQLRVVPAVPVLYPLGLAGRGQPVASVGGHRLQEPVARTVGAVRDRDQGAVDQAGAQAPPLPPGDPAGPRAHAPGP